MKETATCSGSSNGSVRQWLRDIELAVVRLNNAEVIHVVTRTVSGPLRQEVERYLTQTAAARGIQREAVPWDDVRQHITTQFLSADEQAALHDEVENKTKQARFEPENQYSRRFREAAAAAYREGQRNADQNRLLIRAYAKGLTSEKLARKLMEETNTMTLDEAFTTTAEFCARADSYDRLNRTANRNEELMDVSAVSSQQH